MCLSRYQRDRQVGIKYEKQRKVTEHAGALIIQIIHRGTMWTHTFFFVWFFWFFLLGLSCLHLKDMIWADIGSRLPYTPLMSRLTLSPPDPM